MFTELSVYRVRTGLKFSLLTIDFYDHTNSFLFSAHFEQAGIAVIEQLNDLDSKFEIKFILNSNNGMT